jgi:hypothetical protein
MSSRPPDFDQITEWLIMTTLGFAGPLFCLPSGLLIAANDRDWLDARDRPASCAPGADPVAGEQSGSDGALPDKPDMA